MKNPKAPATPEAPKGYLIAETAGVYRVTQACTDFKGRYHEKGERVTVEAGEKVPLWYEPVVEKKPQPATPGVTVADPKNLPELTAELAREQAAPGETVLQPGQPAQLPGADPPAPDPDQAGESTNPDPASPEVK